jgi:L-alanine-DL-glutamate epimerase-like enolase superfamily enzyme
MELPYRGKYADESWASVSFRIQDGAVAVPDAPGLGVTVDPAYLRKPAIVDTASAAG